MNFGSSESQQPAFTSASFAYRPAGTVSGLPTAILLTEPPMRSFMPVTDDPAGAASTRVLPAKITTLHASTTPFLSALSIVSMSALANTSTGAPLTICWSSVLDEPKLKTTLTPGLSASNPLPMSPKAFVRLAAADTTSSCPADAPGDRHKEDTAISSACSAYLMSAFMATSPYALIFHPQ